MQHELIHKWFPSKILVCLPLYFTIFIIIIIRTGTIEVNTRTERTWGGSEIYFCALCTLTNSPCGLSTEMIDLCPIAGSISFAIGVPRLLSYMQFPG